MNEFIKNRANAFKMEPKKDNWAEIERKLSEKRKKRLAWLLVPGVFVIGLALGFLLPKAWETNVSQLEKNVKSQEEYAVVENIEKENVMANKSLKDLKTTSDQSETNEVEFMPSPKETINVRESKSTGRIKHELPYNKNTKLPLDGKAEQKDKQVQKGRAESVTRNVKDEFENNNLSGPKEKGTKQESVEQELGKEKNEKLELLAENTNENEKNAKRDKRNEDNIEGKYSFYLMPYIGQSGYFSVKNDEQVEKAMSYNIYSAESRKKDVLGLSHGVQLGVLGQMKSGWHWSSHLMYQQNTWTSTIGDSFANSSIVTGIPNRDAEANYYNSVGETSYSNKVQTLGLQVGLGKTVWSYKRFDFTPNVHFGLEYVQKANLLNYVYYENAYEESTENSNKTQRILGSAQLGLPINYALTDKFNIGVSPMFRTNLNSILKSDLETKRPYSAGLGLVFQYEIK